MIVAIVGATGVVGRNLIPRLIEARHTIRADVRRIGSALPFLRSPKSRPTFLSRPPWSAC